MLTLTKRLSAASQHPVDFTLALTAEERTRSRHYFESNGHPFYLQLPRGTVLRHGDILQSAEGDRHVQIIARSEPVLTVTANTPLELLRAAYHLGNRHVSLEVAETYLRLLPDTVLQTMLEQMGLAIAVGEHPFQPETGAYSTSHTPHGHTSHGDASHSHTSHNNIPHEATPHSHSHP